MRDLEKTFLKKYSDFFVMNDTEDPLVSVILPCYNVEKYIEKCISSLLKQSFKYFEIVCINDGSTDSTLDIIEAFAKLDKRIKVINKENSGISSARNTGIDNASAGYICFIDSDDWVSENYLESLYNAIKKYNADISASTTIRWRKNRQKYRVHYTEEKVYETLEDKVEICSVPKCCYVWNKLYKTEIIKHHKFADGVYFEDMLWTPEILKNSGKLVTVPDTNYFYRVNKTSIVKEQPSDKKQEDSYNAHKFIIEFFEENGLYLDKKHKVITKKIGYLLNFPLYRIKEFNGWFTCYLFNLIPLFRYSITRYRDFYKIFGLKFTLRKNKKSLTEIKQFNKKYENGSEYSPKVISRIDTLKKLLNSNCSMCRYGDGEFNLILGENLPFQSYSKKLAVKMKEILVSNDENIMVCIPDVFENLSQYKEDTANFWRKSLYYNRCDIEKLLDKNKIYYDALVSRPYMEIADKSYCKKYFDDFKKIWNDKNIVIVEGEASRLGIGNDLFNEAKSIKRILCPAKNSYSKYNEILNACMKFSENTLYIIALGPTATVLAYDLAKTGRRALDLGHIDIEYEWFLMDAKEKVPVKDKYVNECRNGKVITQIDNSEYLSQISVNLSEDK